MTTGRPAALAFAVVAAAALLLAALGALAEPRRRALVIESTSFLGAHDMDRIWMEVAAGAGFDTRIVGQEFLDGPAFAARPDVLVVSSGVIDLSPARVDGLLAYVRSGGRVYLQGEYLKSYKTTAAFERIVRALGARFEWVEESAGDLKPMEVLGRWGKGPRSVPPLGYYWYGVAGAGASPGLEPILRWNGRDYAFAYAPPGPACGMIVHTTDQDWVLKRTSTDLMVNMLATLGDRSACQ